MISSHTHRAPLEHTGQAVNSTVRLTRSETKMTNGPMRATVHPVRRRSCRDNMLHPVAPRRHGPWVPSPRTLGSLGPLTSCAEMPPTLFRVYLLTVAVGKRSLWVASPGVMSQPPVSLGRFSGRRPFVRSTIARWQEATDPQSLEGGSQRTCTHGGCPLHGFRASLRQPYPALTNGGVDNSVVPCGP